jgi:hypothetical protein
MSLLAELNRIVPPILPVETGVFSGEAPGEYAVITPMTDIFGLHADDAPGAEVQEARLSLFTKGNYLTLKRALTGALIAEGLTVTSRRYIGCEEDTGYHHYAIDVAKVYGLED